MKRLVISLSILLILLAASQALAAFDPASNPSPGRAAVGPDSVNKEVNPLIGLPAANPSLLERRPIAI